MSRDAEGNGLSVTVDDDDDVKSVTVAVDGQETRLVFVEYSSFVSPHMAPVISHAVLLYTVSQKPETAQFSSVSCCLSSARL